MLNKKLNCQERVIEIVEALSRNLLKGLLNKELAAEIGVNPVMIHRDISILKKRGWIEKSIETGRWRLSKSVGLMGKRTIDFYFGKQE